MKKIYQDKDWLYEQYIVLKKSSRQIGREFEVGYRAILYQLKKFNIPPHSLCTLTQEDLEIIKRDYNKYSAKDIAECFNVSKKIIWYWAKKLELKREKKMNELYQDRDWLYEQYITLKKSDSQIGKEFGYSDSTIRRWRIRLGVKSRTISETKKGKKNPAASEMMKKEIGKKSRRWKGMEITCIICGHKKHKEPNEIENGGDKFCSDKCYRIWQSQNLTGKNNPNWIDGRSFEPYAKEWTEKLREEIRTRDGRVCSLCGKTEKQELIDLNQRLSVHHIDYDKKNCSPENLKTLCSSCNAKVNFQRGFWVGYFMGSKQKDFRDILEGKKDV